jgi:hypothetical protein
MFKLLSTSLKAPINKVSNSCLHPREHDHSDFITLNTISCSANPGHFLINWCTWQTAGVHRGKRLDIRSSDCSGHSIGPLTESHSMIYITVKLVFFFNLLDSLFFTCNKIILYSYVMRLLGNSIYSYKSSVCASQETRYVTTTKINWLMLFREIINDLLQESYEKHTHTHM